MHKYEHVIAKNLKHFVSLLEAQGVSLPYIPEVKLNLKGHTSGMFVPPYAGKRAYIRLNTDLLDKYLTEMSFHTLGHELAHAVEELAYGGCKKSASGRDIVHGVRFKSICRLLGVKEGTTHSMKTTASRKMRTFEYLCDCEGIVHKLTTIKHNWILNKKRSYQCSKCKTKLEAK